MTQRIVPMIAYADAAAAIDWLTEAFGFRERAGQRFTDEHGTVTHAELERDGAIVMLATPTAEYQGPRRHRETCEAARRWQDNPWVIDGAPRRGGRRRRTPRAGGRRARCGRDPAARGRARAPECACTPPRTSKGTAGCSASRSLRGGVTAASLRPVTGALPPGPPGRVPYGEAWELQRSLAGAVSQGAIPDTVILLEHPPVVTLGRRTDEAAELHLPDGAEVEVVETDRGGKSTYHGPGQLVCYPILDLNRHGRDVKGYVRDLEEAIIRTLGAFGVDGTRDRRADRRLARVAAAQDRLDRRPRLPLGDDPRLRAQRRPRPGAVHGVDHGVRARGRAVHDDRARARPARRGRRRPPAARRRSRRSSASSSRSFRPRTAPASGRSRSTSGSRHAEAASRPPVHKMKAMQPRCPSPSARAGPSG